MTGRIHADEVRFPEGLSAHALRPMITDYLKRHHLREGSGPENLASVRLHQRVAKREPVQPQRREVAVHAPPAELGAEAHHHGQQLQPFHWLNIRSGSDVEQRRFARRTSEAPRQAPSR